MGKCPICEREMADSIGCADERTITFEDGEESEPIAYGEEDRYNTYQDMMDRFHHEIENGGRGNFSPEDVRSEMESFKSRWEADEFNSRSCHDCCAEKGEYHHPGCDSEECPRCGGQYFICDCVTEEKKRLYG